MKRIVPDVAEKIRLNKYKGDFLNIFSRRNQDEKLVSVFSKHWYKNGNQYKLMDSAINLRDNEDFLTMDALEDNLSFLRSDHSRFWTVNQTDFPSLKAILFTDTGKKMVHDFIINFVN